MDEHFPGEDEWNPNPSNASAAQDHEMDNATWAAKRDAWAR